MVSVLVLLIAMGIFWYLACLYQNSGMVDLFWPLAFLIIGYSIWPLNLKPTIYNLIPFILLVSWGYRMFSFFLFTRILPQIKEERYDRMLKMNQQNFKLTMFKQFCIQLVIIIIIATPLYRLFLLPIDQVNFLYWVGCTISLFGIINQALCDIQLFVYKQRHFGVCKTGWWQYSRHPNYFFEITIWIGFCCMNFVFSLPYLTFISPIVLFCVMNFITIPVTEEHALSKRPYLYLLYQKNTSKLIPWARKESSIV